MSEARRPFWRSRWWMPAFCLFLGGLVLAAFVIGGNTADGVGGLALMAALGAVFVFGTRSETIQGLGGPGRDERWASIDLRASAAAGLLTLTIIMGLWLYEIAEGRDGNPYGSIMALSGISYLLAVLFLRRRS